MARHDTTPSDAIVSEIVSLLPIFFRASVYALAAAGLGMVLNLAIGSSLDPLTVFCLTVSGYLGAVGLEAWG